MKKNLLPFLVLSVSLSLPILSLTYNMRNIKEVEQDTVEISYKAISPRGISSGVVLPASCASGWWQLNGSNMHLSIAPQKNGDLGSSYRFNRDIVRDTKWYPLCVGSDRQEPNDILIPLQTQGEKDAFRLSNYITTHDIDVRTQ